MADVNLTIVIPDAYITRVLDALNAVAGASFSIEATKDDTHAHWDFTIAPKGASETNRDFAKRFIRELGKAVINMVDKAEDEQRYRDEISIISPPVSDVPNSILE